MEPKNIEYGVVNIELATSKICGSVFSILRFKLHSNSKWNRSTSIAQHKNIEYGF
jgi:hypothetical protein